MAAHERECGERSEKFIQELCCIYTLRQKIINSESTKFYSPSLMDILALFLFGFERNFYSLFSP